MSDPSAANPVTSVQAAETTSGVKTPGGKGAAAGYDANTTVSSMQDLQEKAPKIYKAMVDGVAMVIIRQMRESNDRLKKMMQEARRDNR